LESYAGFAVGFAFGFVWSMRKKDIRPCIILSGIGNIADFTYSYSYKCKDIVDAYNKSTRRTPANNSKSAST
jgi:hypothetical protein